MLVLLAAREMFYYREDCILHQSILSVYTKGYHYHSYEAWKESTASKGICDFLNQPKYGHYLKGIFFDNMVSYNEDSNSILIDNMMEWTNHLTCFMNELNTILLTTVCSHCHKFCTINFQCENIPIYVDKYGLCITCCIEYVV